jgi:GDP/UDP-N,N'-diacetylbacillosamine 2-epimerase (hydrolysing)
MMPPRKIVYLSGSRADFGLMQTTLALLHRDSRFLLKIAVTGMHLDAAHGNTAQDIEHAGFEVLTRIPTDTQSRSGAGMALSIAQTIEGLVQVLSLDKPDIFLILGDRGEMLAGAIAAMHLGIVIVHIHGGERSGTVDEPVRHAISKLSHYHFVATVQSKDRLIRMGETEHQIAVCGAPGLDGILELAQSVSRSELSQLTGLPVGRSFVLALFHPVVQQEQDAFEQTLVLRRALFSVGLPVLWSTPNADAGSQEILRAMQAQVLPEGSVTVTHLSRGVFCAAMRLCEVMVGNSSSGIIEAASLGTRVVNVGDRQKGRERSDNLVDVDPNQAQIERALNNAIAQSKRKFINVYGDSLAASKIVENMASLTISQAVLEKINTY